MRLKAGFLISLNRMCHVGHIIEKALQPKVPVTYKAIMVTYYLYYTY